jgi:hypothetical protein
MSDLPIADHALLSDRHSAALVTRDGSIVWLCFPRFDSESVFASILDDGAGHWSIRPTAPSRSTRAYVAGTMVLRTTFHTDEGSLELLDALELGDGADPHRLGENASHSLLRGVQCTSGRVTIEMVCRPRPEYGLVVPVLAEIDSGVVATGGSGRLTLSLPAPVTSLGGEVRVQFTLEAGNTGILPCNARTSVSRYLAPTARMRSRPAWRPRPRAGRSGRRSTRAMMARGVSWCIIPDGCCRR